MTTVQITSLFLLAGVAAWVYIPSLLGGIRIPALASKPSVLKEIEDVVRIRDSHRTAEVTTACNQLLSVLLQVKP